MAPTASDQTLVEAARGGDRRAFRALYQRYQRKVFAVAYGFLRNQEDALDIVQEAFIKVHRYLGKFEGQSSFYTWLYRIVANLCIDHLRRSKRKRDVEFDDGLRHDAETDVSGAEFLPYSKLGDPEKALQSTEITEAFEASLKELSDNHAAVIVMRERLGMSYAEMAKAMGCSKGTIMSRLFHARRNMQRLLRERLEHGEQAEEKPGADALAPEAVAP